VACTATVDVGSWLVEPLNGTMVTSESSCPFVTTVVVLVTADAARLVPGPPQAATVPANNTTPRAEDRTTTRLPGRPLVVTGDSFGTVSSLTEWGA